MTSKEDINKIFKAHFKSDLFPASDTELLAELFWDIKKKNYSTDLLGFFPDKNKSIVNISNFIYDLGKKYDEIVVFAFDALSFEYYLSTINKEAANHDISSSVLSSVFPSTSTAAWTSIITGATPSQHGVYGTAFYLKEFDKSYNWIFNALADKEKFNVLWKSKKTPKLNLSKNKTIFQRLQNIGFTNYYLDSHGKDNPFPLLKIMDGSEHIPYLKEDFNDLKRKPNELLNYFLKQTTKLLKKRGKKLIWNYIDVDDYIHENGYKSLTNFNIWETLFQYWSNNKSTKRAFILISDHGQTEQVNSGTNIIKTSILNNDLKYNSSGAGRTMFFYPKPGKLTKVKAWLQKVIGDSGFVLTKKDLVKYGLIDKNAVAQERIGDLITVAVKPDFPSAGAKYFSEHGSLHSEEIYVPILVQTG